MKLYSPRIISCCNQCPNKVSYPGLIDYCAQFPAVILDPNIIPNWCPLEDVKEKDEETTS